MPLVEALELQLRAEIKRQFQEAIFRHRIPTQKEAARQIGVTPAAFSLYMKKRMTPSALVLLKACKQWNLRIRFAEIEFGTKSLQKSQISPRSKPEQLPLFSVLRELGDDSLDIRIQRRGPDSLELGLAIKFA